MIPLVISGLCAAVGFAAGAFTSHAAGEEDRAKADQLNKVNNELIKSRDELEKRYVELTDKSQETTSELERKLMESEIEKDALYLVVRLQNSLVLLMQGLDRNPSFEVLLNFQQAVNQTNGVLHAIGEDLIPIPRDYFSRNLSRAKVKLAKQGIKPTAEQMAVLREILPSASEAMICCPSCGEENAVMKGIAEIRCHDCGSLIDLITRQHDIQWSIDRPRLLTGNVYAA